MKAKNQEQSKHAQKDLSVDEEKKKFQKYNKFWNDNKSQSQRMTQRVNESNPNEK